MVLPAELSSIALTSLTGIGTFWSASVAWKVLNVTRRNLPSVGGFSMSQRSVSSLVTWNVSRFGRGCSGRRMTPWPTTCAFTPFSIAFLLPRRSFDVARRREHEPPRPGGRIGRREHYALWILEDMPSRVVRDLGRPDLGAALRQQAHPGEHGLAVAGPARTVRQERGHALRVERGRALRLREVLEQLRGAGGLGAPQRLLEARHEVGAAVQRNELQ